MAPLVQTFFAIFWFRFQIFVSSFKLRWASPGALVPEVAKCAFAPNLRVSSLAVWGSVCRRWSWEQFSSLAAVKAMSTTIKAGTPPQ